MGFLRSKREKGQEIKYGPHEECLVVVTHRYRRSWMSTLQLLLETKVCLVLATFWTVQELGQDGTKSLISHITTRQIRVHVFKRKVLQLICPTINLVEVLGLVIHFLREAKDLRELLCVI